MSDLPHGWASVALEDVITPRSDRVLPQEMPDAQFIGMEHVEPHTNRIIETVPASTMASNAARFAAGDVLYGRMRPYLNKVVAPSFNGLASAEFIVFPPSDAIDDRFLLRRLSASDFTEFACSQYEGDRPRVKFDQLGKFCLRLPPRSEQSRIVEKLEELLSDLDAGVAELKAAQRKLAQYRQSLLKAAVDGTLTADWRAAHGAPQETGAELLQRILTERRARWEQKQLAKFDVQGKAPPKGWQTKYPEPVAPALADLPQLPEDWAWASVEQVAADEPYALAIGPFGSNLVVADYRDEGVPLVFVRNIRSRKFGGSSTRYVTQEKSKELRAHLVEAGDVLVTKMGEPPGDAAVYPAGQPTAVITADCIKIRPQVGLLGAEYLCAAINSPLGIQQIKPMTQGVAQKKVSLGRFSSFAVPIPPIQEQEALGLLLRAAFDSIQEQEEAAARGLALASAQRKNMLKAAFAGQLVPQDPNDEPAGTLLARIRAERAEQPKHSKTRKNKQPKELAAVVSQLVDVLAEAGGWVSAQEAFRRCGAADGSSTDQIEGLYAELRALDKAGRLEIAPDIDPRGRKIGDRLKLRGK